MFISSGSDSLAYFPVNDHPYMPPAALAYRERRIVRCRVRVRRRRTEDRQRRELRRKQRRVLLAAHLRELRLILSMRPT